MHCALCSYPITMTNRRHETDLGAICDACYRDATGKRSLMASGATVSAEWLALYAAIVLLFSLYLFTH